jgi:hypothetical protein
MGEQLKRLISQKSMHTATQADEIASPLEIFGNSFLLF